MATPVSTPGQLALSLWGADDDVTVLAHRLLAQGYPFWWQGERIGEPIEGIVLRLPSTFATPRTLAALRRVASDVGDKMATPEGDLTEKEVRRARALAAERDYYPPMAYDDDGNLIPEALPEHPWSRDDDRCARRLLVISEVLRGVDKYTVIAERCDIGRKTVYRFKALMDEAIASDPDWPARAAKVLWDWEQGEIPSAQAAVALRLIDPADLSATNPARIRAEADLDQTVKDV